MFSALGLTTIRGCVIGWAISAVVLLVGLALVFTVSPSVGIVLFVLGAIGSVVVAVAMLRVRANVPPQGAALGSRRTTARHSRGGAGPSTSAGDQQL